jgi:hypothetical protein
MEFLAGAVAKGHITQADLRKFSQGTREAPQLYDDKINGIIQNLYKEGVGEMHWYSMIMMYNVTSPEYKYLTDASGKRMKWFNELVDSLPKQFDPYLKIKKYQWKKIE